MDIKQAIEHLRRKFTKSGMKVSKKDLESLNAIISSLNKQEGVILNDNLSLCKLLIHTFKEECKRSSMGNDYKQIDYRIIYSRLRDVFKMDAKSHVDSLYSELYGIQIQQLIDNNKLNKEMMSKLIKKEDVNKNIRNLCSEFISANSL